MDIDIILEADTTPQQMRELAVAAEKIGIRALWASNYHQYWDPFVCTVPAAEVTSKILIGPLAVSPWELHPLKMANALLSLNEIAAGRAMIAIGGGGGVFGAIGWKADPDGDAWPIKLPTQVMRTPPRRVRGVREAIEVLKLARSGQMQMGYPGGVFDINRPFQMAWAEHGGPLVYGACSGPGMIRMGARVADGIQFSDFTVDMMPEAMDNVRAGLAKRDEPAENFRIGNFWAWHIKPERDVGMWEARRELIWRGAVISKDAEELRHYCDDDDELQLIMDNWNNFRKANWTRSGEVEGVPQELVHRLVDGMASAGGFEDLDGEIERFLAFKKAGLTELSLRLHDDPMDALQVIGERVLPAVR
ncbi:MAG: LLM class flavin-dependent oxidoreductase [Gammaproteobacteria bacterium]|nr:LLM class flavin-dependent oxidoreductase [Gammaproteobacteria bacterium]